MVTTRLDRAQVARAALRLLNEVGLEGLSLRRIAQELQVKAPALYWHFKDKRALLDEMATLIQRELDELPVAPEEAPWTEYLAGTARALRSCLLGYRDGAKVFGGTRFTDDRHARRQEEHLARLVAAGFSPGAAARAMALVFAFTMGFVTEEQEVSPLPGERAAGYGVAEREERLRAGHPLAASVSAELFAGHEERFEEGITALITGIDATFPRG